MLVAAVALHAHNTQSTAARVTRRLEYYYSSGGNSDDTTVPELSAVLSTWPSAQQHTAHAHWTLRPSSTSKETHPSGRRIPHTHGGAFSTKPKEDWVDQWSERAAPPSVAIAACPAAGWARAQHSRLCLCRRRIRTHTHTHTHTKPTSSTRLSMESFHHHRRDVGAPPHGRSSMTSARSAYNAVPREDDEERLHRPASSGPPLHQQQPGQRHDSRVRRGPGWARLTTTAIAAFVLITLLVAFLPGPPGSHARRKRPAGTGVPPANHSETGDNHFVLLSSSTKEKLGAPSLSPIQRNDRTMSDVQCRKEFPLFYPQLDDLASWWARKGGIKKQTIDDLESHGSERWGYVRVSLRWTGGACLDGVISASPNAVPPRDCLLLPIGRNSQRPDLHPQLQGGLRNTQFGSCSVARGSDE